ncbi:hypothetical protein GLYMA_08G268350v4 [Glycine max]|nr:hypothetical protein GLYMA_08G268350v4 [Glycine max]KAH1053281.1 hypothetical protein GYH30_022524 [Glycine max]
MNKRKVTLIILTLKILVISQCHIQFSRLHVQTNFNSKSIFHQAAKIIIFNLFKRENMQNRYIVIKHRAWLHDFIETLFGKLEVHLCLASSSQMINVPKDIIECKH